MEATLALCDEAEDDGDSAGSVELGDSNGESDGESGKPSLRVNAIVEVSQLGRGLYYGRIEALGRSDSKSDVLMATVRPLHMGNGVAEDVIEIPTTSLCAKTEAELELKALCTACGS